MQPWLYSAIGSRLEPSKEFHGNGRILEEHRFAQAEALQYTRSHMDMHLIDGRHELFRHFYAVAAAQDVNGREIGAVRAVLRSVLSLIEVKASQCESRPRHPSKSQR